jgi:hypothetical protein
MSRIEQPARHGLDTFPSGSLSGAKSEGRQQRRGDEMSVAKVSEISSTSRESFEDAIKHGITRANKTLRNVRSAWIKEQQVHVTQGSIIEYQVNMMVTFVIDD